MGNNPGNICNDFYSSYPASEYLPGVFGDVGIGGMIIGFVYLCSSAITIAWIRKQQHNPLMGMEGAAKHVVFPIYLPIMWMSALSDSFVGLVIFFVKVSTDGTTIWTNAAIVATALGIQHFVIEGIAVILMQYGCGVRALRIAGAAGGAIGLITFVCVLFFYRMGSDSTVSVIIYFCWMLGLLGFYSTLWLMPQTRLYRRPAVIFYAKFWAIFQVLVIAAVMVGAVGPGVIPEATTISTCIYNVVALPVFVVFKPFIMYTTLLMESKWWQGLLIRAPAEEAAGGGGGGRGSRGRGSGSKASRHLIRYISSVDGALDSLVAGQGNRGTNGNNTELSNNTLGSDARESDGYSSTVAEAPLGFFGTMGRILWDGLRSLGLASKDKFSSVSQYSDGQSSGGAPGREEQDGEGEGDREDSDYDSSGGGSSARGSESVGDLEGGEGAGAEAGDGASAGEPLLGARERPRRGTGERRSSGSSRRVAGEKGQQQQQGTGLLSALSSMKSSAQKMFRRGKRANYDQLKGPLLGVEVGFSEAQELAQEVDNITHEGTVKLLNFAYLSLDRQGKKLLGTGSFSKVYAGRYRNHPVAVKMLFTQDLNPDVIKRCSNEARILTEIAPHPNVVRVFGVAVLPPSVCLVLEICEYGSLSDVLRGGGDSGATVSRPPLNLSYSDRMYLALGCARGVQALHAYSPLLCHRDIKSMNFLIDSQLNAKIADLDLGHQYRELPTAGAGALAGDGRARSLSGGGGIKVGGSNMCIYWQAPEVLLGEAYTQRSDIHSLALVIWEIISSGKTVKFHSAGGGNRESSAAAQGGLGGFRTPSLAGGPAGAQAGAVSSSVSYGTVPYAECKNMEEVREKILKGYRPIIPSAIGTPGSVKSITGGLTRTPDPILLDILQLGWHPEAHLRPDADFVVEGLTRCWRNSLHTTIQETPFLVDLARIQEENFKLTVLQDYSAGAHAKGFRGSNITMASSFLGASLGSHHGQGEASGTSSAGPGSVAGSGSLSSYSRAQGQQRVVRKPPSPEVIASLLLMKSEPAWSKLEDDGAYLVLTPVRPFYMLWATRKWTQLTGYLINDVIAYDVCTLLGPKADHLAVEEALDAVGSCGRAEHIMSTIYRRDGKPMQLSVHMFPVFDSSGDGSLLDGSREGSYYQPHLSTNSASAVAGAVAGTSTLSMDQHLPGRVSFSRCLAQDEEAAKAAHSPAYTGTGEAAGAAVPANTHAATPQKKTPAKFQPYHGSANRTVHSPIQASDHNHYPAPLPSSAAPPRRTTSLTQAVQQQQQPGTGTTDEGYESAGEAERDPASILERIYSPFLGGMASSTLLPRRSVSNVYSVNSAGQVSVKGAASSSVGSLTPAQRSRAPSTAGSAGGDDFSQIDGAMVFESLVEEECAHRKVAYIAVQFSCIRDTTS